MKIALLALTALLPALASADDASPAPYVLHQGRAVRTEAAAPASGDNGVSIRQVSAFGPAPVRTNIIGGRSFSRASSPAPRAFRGSSGHRGITGSGGVGAPTATPSSSNGAAPAYAVPGAKIVSAGQQPVYSEAAGGGTHSVEGGGFIAMDQAKAHDVGRAPGITWAPPDTPPGANPTGSGGGGTGASANGPAPAGTSGSPGGSTSSDGPGHISGTGNGGDNNVGNNGVGSSGTSNDGGAQNNAITFNPAF